MAALWIDYAIQKDWNRHADCVPSRRICARCSDNEDCARKPRLTLLELVVTGIISLLFASGIVAAIVRLAGVL
jgi:hypothetical protein